MGRTLFWKRVSYQQAFNSSCNQSTLWAGNTHADVSKCWFDLHSGKFQHSNAKYPPIQLCSLPLFPVHLAYYCPPLYFFPYMPTAALPLLFQPTLLNSNTNVSYIHKPALVVSLKKFRLAPSTTPPFDSVRQAAPASSQTFYLPRQELAHGFMVTLTNLADSPASNRKEQGQLRPASTRKAESPLASEREKRPLSFSFKGLNTMNTSWPSAHHICT